MKPVIHGLHSSRILIVNEGLRHEFQNWGTDHAPEIDPSLIGDLEVIKGAATVRYGPDALGGVILLNAPKMELSEPLRGQFRLTGQSNGRSGEASLRVRKGWRRMSLLTGASYVRQGDLRAPEYSLTNTGKEEISYLAGIRYHPFAQWDFEVYYSHFDQELGILRGSVNGNLEDLLRALEAEVPNFTEPFSYDIRSPKQEISHDLLKGKISWVGRNQSVSIQYGHQWNHRLEFDVRRGSDLEIPNIDLDLVTQSIEGEWIHPDVGPLHGRVGFQWLKQANDNNPGTGTIPFVPNYDQDRLGGYLIESVEFGDNLFEVGARFDYLYSEIVGRQPNNNLYRNDILYRNVTGMVGYRRRIDEHTSLRSHFGTAWRAPDVAELYRFGRHLSFIEYGLWRYEILEDRDLITTRRILTEED
ncbi:MAG: TonB-dependent receptor, partial [Saprospiraceae bacterium]|nr:TonB-dependent receptor [Saprospiraceae bacterium]